jgi:hypothetical protein
MRKIKVNNIKVRDIEPFEHLEFVVKNTTPYQRYKGLEMAWNFWYEIRKTLPKRIIELQDKFREGKI